MSFEWTPQITITLIALWEEGLTTSEMGRRLGITKNAVIGKVHRLGLPKRVTAAARKPVEEITEGIRMEDLSSSVCCWPEGDPSTENLYFCGKKSIPEKPYCAEHCARAYVKTTRDRDTRKARAA